MYKESMNNKGFTLVELIATIALLAVIAIISFVSINEVVNQSKVSDCENLLLSIKSAAKEYVSDNRYNMVLNEDENKWYFDGSKLEELEINGEKIEYIEITAGKLIDENYLSGDIVSPFDNSKVIGSDSIKIQLQFNDDYTAKEVNLYKVKLLDNGDIEENKLMCVKEQW